MPSTWSMLSIVDIAAKGDLVGVEYKIMHKANLNQVEDMRNNTALMLASKKGYQSIVNLLKEPIQTRRTSMAIQH